MKNTRNQIHALKLAVLMTVISAAAISCWNTTSSGDNSNVTLTAFEKVRSVGRPDTGKTFGVFSHSVDEHEGISCDACHGREGTKLEYAGHSSCVGCHFREFVDNKSQICTICHTIAPDKPEELRSFPVQFNEGFNMMFDHAQHAVGGARPAQGCAACHRPTGSSQTIPGGISTHSQCFTCHTEESGMGSCSTCHDMAPYTRVRPRKSAVLNYVFSHADHTSKQGVTCVECHSPIPNAPQGKQILFPVAEQHFIRRNPRGAVSCAKCHNNRRAFGEANFADCKRCHTASGFTLLPNGRAGS